MKYSQTIGFMLCLALLFCTTQPLVVIESQNWIITGWKTAGTNFGQPGKFIVYVGSLSLVLFLIPNLWAKRLNMALGALLLSWCIRNYLILAACNMGECPEKQWALYASVFFSAAILLMTFLPKLKNKV